MGVYRDGIFRVYLSGACNVGDALITSVNTNYLKSATGETAYALSACKIIGISLETGATGDQILMELRPTSGGGV